MKFLKIMVFIMVSANCFAQTHMNGSAQCDKNIQQDQEKNIQNFLSNTEVVINKLLPKVMAEDQLDYDVNLSHLQKGGSQYSTDFDDVKSFVKNNPTMKTIDFKGLFNNVDSHVWASKATYVLDTDPQWFTDEALNDAVYQERTMPKDFKVSPVKGHPNQLQYNKEASSFFGLYKIPSVESVSEGFSYDLTTKKGEMLPEHVKGILAMNPEIKGNPEKITVSFTVRTNDKRSKGTISVSKYYRINKNKTLLVNYCFAVVDKPFLVPAWGIRKAIKAFAPKESGKLVRQMRKYSGAMKGDHVLNNSATPSENDDESSTSSLSRSKSLEQDELEDDFSKLDV